MSKYLEKNVKVLNTSYLVFINNSEHMALLLETSIVTEMDCPNKCRGRELIFFEWFLY